MNEIISQCSFQYMIYFRNSLYEKTSWRYGSYLFKRSADSVHVSLDGATSNKWIILFHQFNHIENIANLLNVFFDHSFHCYCNIVHTLIFFNLVTRSMALALKIGGVSLQTAKPTRIIRRRTTIATAKHQVVPAPLTGRSLRLSTTSKYWLEIQIYFYGSE